MMSALFMILLNIAPPVGNRMSHNYGPLTCLFTYLFAKSESS